MENLWTVEWSQSQQCFHIDALQKTITRNIAAFMHNRSNDYQLLYIAKSQEKASEAIAKLEKEFPRKAA
jgi:hypothetical protein